MSTPNSRIDDRINEAELNIREITLSSSERALYDFIRRRGEVMTSNLPPKIRGALPHLIQKGLVAIYKKQTAPWSVKKRKFVAAKT